MLIATPTFPLLLTSVLILPVLNASSICMRSASDGKGNDSFSTWYIDRLLYID